jgi:hypothetical protein
LLAYGGYLIVTGDCTISGNAQRHVLAGQNSILTYVSGTTVALSGTRNWSVEGLTAITGAVIQFNTTSVTGSATGKRYSVTSNGVILGTSANVNFWPGNVAGTTGTGGVYG